MLFISFSCDRTPLTKNALLLFIGTDTPSWSEIKDEFKAWSEDNVVDPELFILGSVKSVEQLVQSASTDAECSVDIEIVGKLCNIRLLAFCAGGHIHNVPLNGAKADIDGLSDVLQPAVERYIGSELQTSNVVVAAPQGFYFSKLSNRYSSHFIRTESLLSSSASIELLALRLLKSFREYCDGLAERKVRVLVDSMAIWPLAQALVSLRREDDPKRRYVVESFRSYDGLGDDGVESGPAFVIISASTSGGLERRLLQKLGPKHAECHTILCLEPYRVPTEQKTDEVAKRSVFLVPRQLTGQASLEGLRPVFETDVSEVPPGCETVRIIGERFLNQNFRPKAVRLAHKALEDGRKTTLAQIARDHIALSARRRPDGKSHWSVSFDVAALINKYCTDDESGGCKLRSWLANYAVAGNMAVIYPVDTLESGRPDEGQAKLMAQRIRDLLLERAPSNEIRVLDSSKLDNPDEDLRHFISGAGVVVAAPVVGNGFVFKQISATLRATQPKGPRLYIALAALPESQARLQELRTDLQLNADESAYHFKCAIAMPVGKVDQDIDWVEEQQIVQRVVEACDDDGIDVPELLRSRLREFRSGNGLGGKFTFMPSYSGNALAMSPGFLLWMTKTAIAGNDLGAAVLLTVAVFLESCRTAGTKESDTSLISGLFQQTLVAPANFTRFNDTAIQAALLRAAYKSELNFSSSPDMSSDMQRLILKLMQLHDAPAGEALPEFLLALAMGRLTLQKEHLQEMVQRVRTLPGWLGVLGRQLEA